jgi:hypothetical protein
VTETLAPFIGTWRLQRTIEDFRDTGTSVFAGEACFEPSPSGLNYVERGRWQSETLSGLTGERRYRWSGDARGKISVFFENGAPFHEFFFQDGSDANGTHFCDPDTYQVFYTFSFPDTWTAVWQVKGPRKDYRSHTTYSR